MPPVGQRSGHLEAQTAVVGLEDLQILFCCGLGDGCAISLEERDDPGDMVIELNGSNVEQGLARLLRARNLLAGSHLDPAPHPSANDGARRHCGSGLESMECRCRNSNDPVGDTNCSQTTASNDSADRVMADIESIRDLFDGIPSLLGHFASPAFLCVVAYYNAQDALVKPAGCASAGVAAPLAGGCEQQHDAACVSDPGLPLISSSCRQL